MTVRRVGATTENLRKIMATTFRTANKTGFAAMSQRDLSRESGLSIGGLYGCIKTKDDLAAMIADVVRYSNTAFPEWFADWSDLKKVWKRRRAATSSWPNYFIHGSTSSSWIHAHYPVLESQSPRPAIFHSQQELMRLMSASKLERGPQIELLASHCLPLIQDWYVKRWKYHQLRITVDEFANSVCHLMPTLSAGSPGRNHVQNDIERTGSKSPRAGSTPGYVNLLGGRFP